MKIIWLTKGQFTLVDDEDFERLNKWKWYAHKGTSTFYACRRENVAYKKYVSISMHRYLLGLSDSKTMADHKDGNGLNNQRANLRGATRSQNAANSRNRKDGSSKYKGVSWTVRDKRWAANIDLNSVRISLGYFINEADAAIAYNEAAIKYHGQFAKINLL